MENPNQPNDDLLTGVAEIAPFIKRSRRATYQLRDKGILPIFEIGGILYARKSTLNRLFAEREAAVLAAASSAESPATPDPETSQNPEPGRRRSRKRRAAP